MPNLTRDPSLPTNAGCRDLGVVEAVCVWAEDPDGVWEGSCGMMWNLESDTPAENGMNYCPRCGAKLGQAQETPHA